MFYEKKSLSIINLIPLYRILYLPDFANNFADFPFFIQTVWTLIFLE